MLEHAAGYGPGNLLSFILAETCSFFVVQARKISISKLATCYIYGLDNYKLQHNLVRSNNLNF
jgi:hypothetical protein